MMYSESYFCPPPVGGDLILLLVHAIGRMEQIVRRWVPLTYPPSDLRVTTSDGAPISGIIVVDHGLLVVGLTVRGCPPPRHEPTPTRTVGRPLVDIYRDDSTRLRGWADNDEEDDPWPR